MMSLGIAAHGGIYPHKAEGHVLMPQIQQMGASPVEPGLTTPPKNHLCFTNEVSLLSSAFTGTLFWSLKAPGGFGQSSQL